MWNAFNNWTAQRALRMYAVNVLAMEFSCRVLPSYFVRYKWRRTVPSGRSTHKHKSMSNMTCQGYQSPFLFYLFLECRSNSTNRSKILFVRVTHSIPDPCAYNTTHLLYVAMSSSLVVFANEYANEFANDYVNVTMAVLVALSVYYISTSPSMHAVLVLSYSVSCKY